MRIIAGDKKGMTLRVPEGEATRPTLSRVRESLFSMLTPILADARVVDLYAGSGSLGFEALSRGASHCVFVEIGRKALDCLHHNAVHLKLKDQTTVVPKDVVRWLNSQEELVADIVFIDAPYEERETAKVLAAVEQKVSSPDVLVVLQTASYFKVEEWLKDLEVAREKKYGKTTLYFLRKKESN